MTNQRAGAAVLKGGLLQCYQLQARVYGAPNRGGDRTLPRCERLGTPLASPVAVPPFCHRRLCVAATGGDGNTQGLQQPARH